MKHFEIDGRRIGRGEPVYVIAEIGYNFNNLDQARASIEAAAACGVDAVKFQTFRAATVTSRLTDFPEEAGTANQYAEFERYELSEQAHRTLFEHARGCRVAAFSTPSYYDDVDMLDRLGVPAHKVGSDDLTNLPFQQYVARTGKPMIFSTGMGSQSEVAAVYEAVSATGNPNFAILHCVSNYPIRDMSIVNLRVIQTYDQMFDVPIGFSDHTTGTTAALGAVAMGAAIIERHFTLDKGLDVPDAFFSADPDEMKRLVDGIREVEQALGDGIKRPAASELDMRRETRKSVIARRDLEPGERVGPDDIIVKRPGTGIAPAIAHLAVGRRVKRAIAHDEPITWEMLD